MIVFDSNEKNIWSGKGFVISGKTIIAHKNANFKHGILLQAGDYSFRIFAKNRTGNSPICYKIVTDRDVVISTGKISLGKVWSEESFNFSIQKNSGMGFLYLYREPTTFGSAEIGRLILEKNEVVNISDKNKGTQKQAINQEQQIAIQNKAMRKKVAFVIPYAIYGGAEVYIETILNNIDSKLLNIHILYLKDNPLKYTLSNKSIVHKIITSNDNFINYIKTQEFDSIVYYNSLNAYSLIQSSISAINKKPKLIEIYHSDFKWSDSISNIKHRNNIDIAFRVSDNLLIDVSGIKNKIKLSVPIDTDKFFVRNNRQFSNNDLKIPEKKNIGIVARLSPEKNLTYALSIAKNMPEFNFLIFGEGNQEQMLKKVASNENIKNVFFMGFKKDVYKYYSIFDAFLLTSKMEGTPISILEAMASGVPVFTTNVGQISSIIKNNNTGFLLTEDIKTDVNIINANISNSIVVQNAKKYIEQEHNKDIIASTFLECLFNIQNNFTKRNQVRILGGEYI